MRAMAAARCCCADEGGRGGLPALRPLFDKLAFMGTLPGAWVPKALPTKGEDIWGALCDGTGEECWLARPGWRCCA